MSDMLLCLSTQQLAALNSLLAVLTKVSSANNGQHHKDDSMYGDGLPEVPSAAAQCEPSQFPVPLELLLTCRSFKLILYNDDYVTEKNTSPFKGQATVEQQRESQSADKEKKRAKVLLPYVEISVDQPHLFCTLGPSRQELSLSLYTLHIALPSKENHIIFKKNLHTHFTQKIPKCIKHLWPVIFIFFIDVTDAI